VKVELRDLDAESIADLFSPCGECVYWEAPAESAPMVGAEKAIPIKRRWLESVRRVPGAGTKIAYVDSVSVGYCQYAPPHLVPMAAEYAEHLAPPSPDAVLLTCLYVPGEHQGKGLGTAMLQELIGELSGAGCRAVETYSRDDSSNNCSGPTEFYLKNGFAVVAAGEWEQAVFSLMRRELIAASSCQGEDEGGGGPGARRITDRR
jgi:GNAT superfamily N-acetyltransferase